MIQCDFAFATGYLCGQRATQFVALPSPSFSNKRVICRCKDHGIVFDQRPGLVFLTEQEVEVYAVHDA